MLRAHCISHQFKEYWLDSRLPMMKEAEFIIMQCHEFLEMENHDDELQNLCTQFQESADVSGYRLFKLAQNVFEDKLNLGSLIVIFAFSTKLLNRERERDFVLVLDNFSINTSFDWGNHHFASRY